MPSSFLRRRREDETTRTVEVNSPSPNPDYANNETSTTKYNLLTFLPKALFEQYRFCCDDARRRLSPSNQLCARAGESQTGISPSWPSSR